MVDEGFGAAARAAVLLSRQAVPATRVAIELAGWRVVASTTVGGAEALLAEHRGAIAVLDLAGVGEDDLHPLVAAAAAAAQAAGSALVIVADTTQIDMVVDAAPEDTILLCEPGDADWPVMLALAAHGGQGGGRVREDERERLARLHAEIARIAAMLAALAEQPGGGAQDRSPPFAAPAPPVTVSAADVRRVIRARRLRDRFFGEGLFADPAWDMLLDLFAAELEGSRVSVSSLCIAAAVPPTTALRWITTLSAAGLLERAADPEDRRRAFLSLSQAGGEGMRRYLAAAREAGLPLV